MKTKSRHHSQYHLLGTVLVLLIAAALRFAIFSSGLPYVENVDAPNFYLLANDERGQLDARWRNEWLGGYPPGFIWLYARVLDYLDQVTDYSVHTDMQYYVANIRLVSIAMSLITLACVMTLARWFGNEWTGLLAGVTYGFSAEIVRLAAISLPDPSTTMFVVLSALVGVYALKKQNAFIALLTTILCLISILFKYPIAPILIIPACFFLYDLWQRRADALPTAALALMGVLTTAYYLLVVHDAGALDNVERKNIQANFWQNLLDLEKWETVAMSFVDILGMPLVILGLVSIAYPVIFQHKRHQIKWHPAYWITLLAGFLLFAMIPLYIYYMSQAGRYGLAAIALFAVILAARQRDLPRWAMLLVMGLVIVWALPQTSQLIIEKNRPYNYARIQEWFIENIPDNSVIWTTSYAASRPLRRYEAGYWGYAEYDVLGLSEYAWDIDPDRLNFVYLTDNNVNNWPEYPNLPPLSDFYLIKHLDNKGYNNDALNIFLVNPLETTAAVRLHDDQNALLLDTYSMTQVERTITLQSYWQAPDHVPTRDYSYTLYITAVDDTNTSLAQQDASLGHRRTSTWDDPHERLRGDMTAFTLPDDLPSGDYQLWLAVYYWETGERMQLDDGGNAYPLAIISLS